MAILKGMKHYHLNHTVDLLNSASGFNELELAKNGSTLLYYSTIFFKGVEDGDDIYLIKKWEQHVAMLSKKCNM